jgi:UDP-4-amino-4,6-dideoxy-N-acetyl-beta-L-altrosamine transaminase/dTDP-4-dehydrorhamnose reductase
MNTWPDKQNLLITGVSGLLGNNLAYYFARKFNVLGLYKDHPVIVPGTRTEGCDLLDEESLRRIVEGFHPAVVIHCASLASVDQCERDPRESHRLNVVCTQNVGDALDGIDARLIYISTDSVYEGTKGGYSEEDAIRPLNVYGQTKWEGEKAVLQRRDGLVLRTNLFGWNIQDKKSLGEWILDELLAGREVGGFHDAMFSTIYTMELARVIDMAIQKKLFGLYNCGSSDACSKFEFACKIAERFGFERSLIKPISIGDFKFQARRGKNLTFRTQKIQTALGYRMPTIDQSIETFYKDFRCGMREEIRHEPDHRRDGSPLIPYGRQWIDENDIQAVVQVLRSDRVTQGPKVEEFEKALADYCGAKYAVAVNSGTSALHIACLAAGIGPGDEVITSPITFVASANCAAYCEAKPVFADIDPHTYNISPDEILKKISGKTAAVIPVHMAGQSCDMEAIANISRRAVNSKNCSVVLIEDASHALGSLYKGKKVGACAWSDMTVTSFHPVKHITTGEGGAVLTNDEFYWRKLRRYRSHGITNQPEEFTRKERAFQRDPSGRNLVPHPWYYEQLDLGYNYRITDIQSALGLSQLKKMDPIRRRRSEIVKRYNDAFRNLDWLITPRESPDCHTNFHLYIGLFDFKAIGMGRSEVASRLRSRGIQTQVHYIPVNLQPYFENRFGTARGDCPRAEDYYDKCLSLPLFPALCDQEVERVIREIRALGPGPRR